jgi:phytoene/squalene synthetase
VIGALLHVVLRLLENLRADRDRPPLDPLGRIEDAERFCWRVLPYAARSFSFCIAVLPKRMARTLRVAYLYCRMLDTCEDLPREAAEKDAALAAFLARFDALGPDGGAPAPLPLAAAPALSQSLARDARDRVYLMLLARAERVDTCFAALAPAHRAVVVRLVRRMGASMRAAVATFAAQGMQLRDEAQLSAYCFGVLGQPMRFAEELACVEAGRDAELPPERVALAAMVGEAIQLANVARDLEKDTAHGLCYLPELAAAGRPAAAAAIAAARRKLLERALLLGARFDDWLIGVPSPRVSLARAGGLLMALFTLRFWQATSDRLALSIIARDERIGRLGAAVALSRSVLSPTFASDFARRLAQCYACSGRRLFADGAAWTRAQALAMARARAAASPPTSPIETPAPSIPPPPGRTGCSSGADGA